MQATVKMVDHVLHGMPKLLRDKILLYLHQHIDPNRRNLVANPLLAAAYNHKQGAYRVNDYKVAMKNGFTSVHAMKRGGLSNDLTRSTFKLGNALIVSTFFFTFGTRLHTGWILGASNFWL
jgi:hypothetical protein